MKTFTLTLTYALAILTLLFWFGVVKAACLCDRDTRQAWNAGEAFDRFDPALSRVEALHVALFGSEE